MGTGKNIIKSVKLDLGGKTVDLTIEQAKNLKVALDELLGEKVVTKEVVKHEYIPTYPWYWREPRPFWDPNITWGTEIGDQPALTMSSGFGAEFSANSGTMTLRVA